MKHLFAKLALAGVIGISALGTLSAPAAADTIRLGIESGGIVDVQYRGHYGDERDWGRDRDRHRPGWGHDRRGRCSPGLAQDKARDFGLRRARVVDVSQRRVVVEGRRHGDYRTIAFANVPGCPIIRR